MTNKNAKKSKTPGLPVRLGALYLLRAILERRQPLDEKLLQNLDAKFHLPISNRDKSHIRAIVGTVLRNLGQIDSVIAILLSKPLPKRAKGVEFILRIGVAELLFLKSEPHAVVNTALEVAKTEKALSPFTGLINASLRRVARETDKLAEEMAQPVANIPEWVADRWMKNFGGESLHLIAKAISEEPPLDLTVASDSKKWASLLEGQITPSGSVRLKSSVRIENLQGFQEGQWWVQDAAAALPVKLFGDLEEQEVLDLCAAPGGKTMQLACMGAKVTAVDRSSARMKIVAKNLERINQKAELIESDILSLEPGRKWMQILLDAPCSATGTSRRHPDILHLKTESEIVRLAKLQEKLLRKAVSLLDEGGVLVYCTCSLEPEEGIDQLSKLLSEEQGLVQLPITPEEVDGQDQFVDSHGVLQTLPCHWMELGGLDGFFAFRIQKKKS